MWASRGEGDEEDDSEEEDSDEEEESGSEEEESGSEEDENDIAAGPSKSKSAAATKEKGKGVSFGGTSTVTIESKEARAKAEESSDEEDEAPKGKSKGDANQNRDAGKARKIASLSSEAPRELTRKERCVHLPLCLGDFMLTTRTERRETRKLLPSGIESCTKRARCVCLVTRRCLTQSSSSYRLKKRKRILRVSPRFEQSEQLPPRSRRLRKRVRLAIRYRSSSHYICDAQRRSSDSRRPSSPRRDARSDNSSPKAAHCTVRCEG